MKIAAFDIGGTSLKMACVTPDGQIIKQQSASVGDSDGKQILQQMHDWVKKNPDCGGIAVSAPGHVNPHSGLISMGGAIRHFDNFNLKQWLEQMSGLPVSIENDANCVLLAEKWLGSAQHLQDFLCLTIGTGIGGGIYANGSLIRGGRFRAGEFGYMFSERPGAEVPNNSTMNKVCTLKVLRERYAEFTQRSWEEVSGEEIFEGYDAQNPLCLRLVNAFYDDICTGLYNLINIFDPTHIFIGGGITSRCGFINELLSHMAWLGQRDTIIQCATHKNDAGLLGATYHFICQKKPTQ